MVFGGLLATSGGVVLKLWSHPLGLITGGILSAIGIALVLYGAFELTSTGRILRKWKPEVLYRALSNAPPDATIGILQTSIPDVTSLIGCLHELLTNQKKQFRLRILLTDYEQAKPLVEARVRLRIETADAHAAEIRSSIDQFIRVKQLVDAEWKQTMSGAQLDLQIRLYSFLPFGSIFQIGDQRIFSGLFWNWTSSINGPMIVITDKRSETWKCFAKHFSSGWETARQIYPVADTPPSNHTRSPTDALASH